MQIVTPKFTHSLTAFLLIIVPLFLLLSVFHPVNAASVDLYGGEQSNIETNIGLSGVHPAVLAARIINVFLGFMGIIALSLIVYSGFLWMTSGGDPAKIEKSKKMIVAAVVGLIIVMSSFALVRYFLGKFGLIGSGGSSQNSGANVGLSVLGQNIVQSHYPARNQMGVPRNTSIVVTFREQILASSLIIKNPANPLPAPYGTCAIPSDITTCDTVSTSSVLIFDEKKGSAYALGNVAVLTVDNRTFVFKPLEPIGSPSEELWHKVQLTNNIKKAGGTNAFPPTGYWWRFQVSTILDSTPPRITSIWPIASATQPKNVIIQINFSEAVNPLSASGDSSSTSLWRNLQVASGTAQVEGIFAISNQYRTVEFIASNPCGVNSCGTTIFCLPGSSLINVLVQAASTTFGFPPIGVSDMADNSLDGNKNGTAEGPLAESGKAPYNLNGPTAAQGDDVIWNFSTTDVIDITAPTVISMLPPNGSTGLTPNELIQARFDKILMTRTLHDNVVLFATSSAVSYWPYSEASSTVSQTIITINHDPLMADAKYQPQLKADIMDVYQNCYKPCAGSGAVACAANATNESCCNLAPTAGATCGF